MSLVVLVTLLALAACALFWSVEAGWWNPRVERLILDKSGLNVRIGALKWRPLESLHVDEVRFDDPSGDPAPIVTIRDVTMEYDGASVLEGRISRIEIGALAVRLTPAAVDRLRAARPDIAPAEGPPIEWKIGAVHLGRLDIDWTDGAYNLRAGPGEITATEVTAGGTSNLRVAVPLPNGAGRIAFDGTVLFEDSPIVKGKWRAEGLDLSALRRLIPGDRLPAELACEGLASLTGDVAVNGMQNDVKWSADIEGVSARLPGDIACQGGMKASGGFVIDRARNEVRWNAEVKDVDARFSSDFACQGSAKASGALLLDGTRNDVQWSADVQGMNARLPGDIACQGDVKISGDLTLDGTQWKVRSAGTAHGLSASHPPWSVPALDIAFSASASGDGSHGRWELAEARPTHAAWKSLLVSAKGTLGPFDWTSATLKGDGVDLQTVVGWTGQDLGGSPMGTLDATGEGAHAGDEISLLARVAGRGVKWAPKEGDAIGIPDSDFDVEALVRPSVTEAAIQARYSVVSGSETGGPVLVKRDGGPTTGTLAGVLRWPAEGMRAKASVTCSVPALSLEATDGSWRVEPAGSELNAGIDFDKGTGVILVDGGYLRTVLGTISFSGSVGQKGPTVNIHASAPDLAIDKLRAAIPKGLPSAWADWSAEGKVSLDASIVRKEAADSWTLRAETTLTEGGVASPDFSLELRRLKSKVLAEAVLPADKPGPIGLQVTGSIEEGSVSAGRLYHSLASPGIEFALNADWDATDPKARRVAWRDGRIAYAGFASVDALAGACAIDAEGRPLTASGRIADADLGALYHSFVQEPFSGTKEFLRSLEVSGHAAGDFSATQDGSRWGLDGHVSLRDATVSFGALRVERMNLDALPFALRSPESAAPVAPEAVPAESRGSLRIARISDGPIDLRDQAWTISLHENAFAIHDALEWRDLLGGTVRISGFTARGLIGDSMSVETALSCEDLEISSVRDLAGWKHTPTGTVSLHYPRIVFADDRLKFEGETIAHLWNGEIRVKDFTVSDCFSDGRSVRFSAVLEHLDLELLARTFTEIGEVHGLFEGRLDDFEFSAGEPWRFELYVHGLSEEKGPKWMSAQAVESATAVTAGGFQGIGEQILKSKEWTYRYLGAYMRMGPGEDGLLRVVMRGAYRKRPGGLLPIPKFEEIPLADLRANKVVEGDEEYFLVGPLVGGLNITNGTPGGTVRRDLFLKRIQQVMSAKVKVDTGEKR